MKYGLLIKKLIKRSKSHTDIFFVIFLAECLTSEFRVSKNQFQCDNRRCIPSAWKCDKNFDCGPGDDSDERDCGKLLEL